MSIFSKKLLQIEIDHFGLLHTELCAVQPGSSYVSARGVSALQPTRPLTTHIPCLSHNETLQELVNNELWNGCDWTRL